VYAELVLHELKSTFRQDQMSVEELFSVMFKSGNFSSVIMYRYIIKLIFFALISLAPVFSWSTELKVLTDHSN
jgi:hypothetical protein